MEIKEFKLKGVFEIILNPNIDERGFFMRVYDKKLMQEFGVKNDWVQENHSRSEKKSIIRGLHFQFPPFEETKLIRCIRGSVLDVFVDLRKKSPTFGKWDSIILSEENKKMVLVPRGFAHGFCTLTEISEVLYKVDNYYAPEYEGGIIWNDPDLNIKWPVEQPILSEKDKNNITFKEFIIKYGGIEL
ncbi:MAG: dTDP-4-dehydrorhamnose 3,5-epimerase [Petrotoga sp.]|jgi:dTDP-4-dehydrorhamnose 3,5-epimerase|nr:dTDP-4-dehydrorhamnose 3,5-epimerase [Petrotoga sp.]